MNDRSSAGELTRRAALGALAAAGAAFAVFGPRGARETSGGRVVLDYWEKWTGHEGRAMQRVVEEFNNSQNRIQVRYLVTAGIDQKTLISVAGGDPPDVVGLWNYNVPLYAESEAIIPIDEFGSKFGVRLENYAAGVRPIMTYPDHSGRERLWATINTGGTLAMYYNRAAFREVGLDPDRPPRTTSEFDEYAAKLDRFGPGKHLERAGFMHTEPGWWSWIWGYHFGGVLYDAPADRCLADATENLAAYRWLQRYSQRLGVEEVVRFRSGFGTAYDSPLNGLLDGKVAMVVQGPWLANVIQAHKPSLDYGVAPFPVADGLYDSNAPIGLIDTDILVIPRGVKYPEASMEFVAYTQRQEVVEFLSNAHCKNSPLVSASEEFLSQHVNRGVRVHGAIAASPRSFLCPRTRTWPQFKDEFDASVQRMWTHARGAEEELAAITTKVQGLLDRAADERRRRGYGAVGGAPS